MKLKPKYSGKESTKFWDEINAIKNHEEWDKAYTLGVVLQNIEADILRFLKQIQRS
jgi:hypothetical protein